MARWLWRNTVLPQILIKVSGKHAPFSRFKYVYIQNSVCLKGPFCAQLVIFSSLCSSESLQRRLDDAGKTTIDLDQDAADVNSLFDKDILKTIKVTIHQHTPAGETQSGDDEKVEVCGGLDSAMSSIAIS